MKAKKTLALPAKPKQPSFADLERKASEDSRKTLEANKAIYKELRRSAGFVD